MSQQQLAVINAINEVFRTTYAPARTVAIAQRCYMSDRNMRRKLVELERSGVVRRVGRCGGWLPAA